MDAGTDAQLRNLKDFLMIYNRMTENCFLRCVDEMNSRHLNRDEERCVNHCSSKFISANHRMMSIYIDVQSAQISKRVEEAQAAAAAQENATIQQQN